MAENTVDFKPAPQAAGQIQIGSQYEAFPIDLEKDFGACFSDSMKFRYSLWRIWDRSLPLVMFIGLNPSKANERTNDNTVSKVIKISRFNGYGGVFMMNCFPMVSTDPKKLDDLTNVEINDQWLQSVRAKCKDVVFAWGSFKVVKETERDKKLIAMFPNALALKINASGTPKHPLYCKIKSILIPFSAQQ